MRLVAVLHPPGAGPGAATSLGDIPIGRRCSGVRWEGLVLIIGRRRRLRPLLHPRPVYEAADRSAGRLYRRTQRIAEVASVTQREHELHRLVDRDSPQRPEVDRLRGLLRCGTLAHGEIGGIEAQFEIVPTVDKDWSLQNCRLPFGVRKLHAAEPCALPDPCYRTVAIVAPAIRRAGRPVTSRI